MIGLKYDNKRMVGICINRHCLHRGHDWALLCRHLVIHFLD